MMSKEGIVCFIIRLGNKTYGEKNQVSTSTIDEANFSNFMGCILKLRLKKSSHERAPHPSIYHYSGASYLE